MATRVLVVDDSPTIRRVVSAVLERHGFEAAHAPDGQAALEQLVEAAESKANGEGDGLGRFDLVLVDFVMPKMNGFQLCRAIRQDERLRSIPVVLMSAKSDRIREHFVQQTGAIDAITKPFDAHALVAVIENAIRRAAEWRASRGSLPDPVEVVEHVKVTSVDTGGPRIALFGDIGIIPIGAVLQLLQIESKTGVLVITDSNTEVSIAIREGLIDLVQARGAGVEFRLGRYFVEHGLVTADDIDRLLRDNAPTPKPPSPEQLPRGAIKEESPTSGKKLLGDLLVDSGRVTRVQLREALARQSSELVYEVLRWPRGRFEFRRENLPALAESARLALPVASVVMEGFRRVDEWRRPR